MSEKILVVDDEQDIRKIVSFLLKNWGYEVLTANNGLEGLELLEKEIPDLILLDVSMPKMTGFQMLEQIRANPRLKDLPVIMLTAHSDTNSIDVSASYGILDYITKPFEPYELRERIDAIISKVS